MNRKLKINTAAGIIDIIGAILYFIAPFVIVGSAFTEAAQETNEGTTSGIALVFILYAGIGLVLHIIGLVKSKKAGISIVGHVLGIIGHGLYFIFGALLFVPAFVLAILAAIFTLMQKNLPRETQQEL